MDGKTPGEDRDSDGAQDLMAIQSWDAHERAELAEARADAFKEGYTEAVARLRDDERFRNWWTAPRLLEDLGARYWSPQARRHLADYLETVGVDQ